MSTLESAGLGIKSIPSDLTSDRVISPKDTAALLGISLATLHRLWREGRGPKRLRVSRHRLGVRLRDLRDYLDRAAV